MKVRNMTSSRGNLVPNQFIITGAIVKIGRKNIEGTMFQSYDSNIAFKPYEGNAIYLGEDWNYSRTTSKYRNDFLGMDTNELKARIKTGAAIVKEDL